MFKSFAVIASATNDISIANTGDWGYAAGFELEMKKNILNFDDKQTLTGGLNLAYMKTNQELNDEKVRNDEFTIQESNYSSCKSLLCDDIIELFL